MDDEDSKFREFISYAIFGAVLFASFGAPILLFVLHKVFGWEPPQFLQDWIGFFSYE